MQGKHLSFFEVLDKLPDNVLFAGAFYGFTKETLFKCGVCGFHWENTPQGVSHTKYGCPQCAAEIRNESRSRTTESYRTELKNKHHGLTVLEEYVRDAPLLLHRCTCRHEWLARPGHLLRAKFGCPKCARTAGATALRSTKLLTVRNTVFQLQGSEDKAVRWLVAKGVSPKEIHTSLDDKVPSIPYAYRDAIRIHYPDFLVRGVVIEVKGLYTLGIRGDKNNWLEQNKAKTRGAELLKIPYRILVDAGKTMRLLPLNWQSWCNLKLKSYLLT